MLRALCDLNLVSTLSASKGKPDDQRLGFPLKHDGLRILFTFLRPRHRASLEVHNALPEHQFGILGALWGSRFPNGQECTADDERRRGGRRHANLGQAGLGLPSKLGAQPKEIAIALRAVGHVVPARIALQAVVEGAGSQFFQDYITGTSLPLWIGIIAED